MSCENNEFLSGVRRGAGANQIQSRKIRQTFTATDHRDRIFFALSKFNFVLDGGEARKRTSDNANNGDAGR